VSAKPIYLLHTNLLLRFLLNDHPAHGAAAKRLFEEAAAGKSVVLVPLIAIAETVFTLQSFYKIDRADIGKGLLTVLTASGVRLTASAWMLDAIEFFRTRNVSFGDACLAAEAASAQLVVASFDRGLDKFPGMKRHEPRP
jgi:predicted nucleic-acid-binding protein